MAEVAEAAGEGPGEGPGEGEGRGVRERVELRGGKKLLAIALFCVACVAVNFVGSQIAAAIDAPVYFDCLGIIVASAFGGYIPGIVVGYFTNFVTSVSDPSSFYYCLTSVLIAVCAAWFARRGWFEKLPTILLAILAFAAIGGGLGSVITWCLYGPDEGSAATFAAFVAQLGPSFLWDVVDKAVTVAIAVALIRVLPGRLRTALNLTFWQQAPLEGDELKAVRHVETPRLSLRAKVVVIVAVVMVVVAVVTTAISFMMFHRANVDSQTRKGEGITELMASEVDGDRVDLYLQYGARAAGYTTTNRELASIAESFPDVEYVYVYQILEDGCHVVFDPDTVGVDGQPGEVIEFEEAFDPYLDDLLAGREIDPIISNGDYGWLLTVYRPVFNSDGECACYVGADISMDYLVEDEFAFLSRIIILFAAFFALVVAVAIWLAEYGLIMPVNSIARASGNFAFESESSREDSVEQLRRLNVHTGDEVENLYHAVTKMSEDTVQFIADSQEKAETIERMQDNLIMVMADLVESRDEHTGDHVRKTAAYCDVVMKQMRKEGIYADELTDEFMSNVVKSAPLHDVGKISVSDTILNKPGRLTDEEFSAMQGHTLAGKDILEDAVGAMSDPGYLDEARRLAAFHHEKWNGKGYPYGLAGEDIPLSARIMAVADVFDALVSKRSYKEGMPIEKALQIIHDDAGTHFDPQVAAAFLHAEAEVRRVAEEHGDAHGTAGDIRDE